MRVLIINKFLYPNGGSETYIFKLGEALEQHGHEVQYFGMEHEGRCVGNRVNAYTSDMDFHGGSKLSKLTYPIKTIYSKEAREKLRLVLDDFKPDVCHLNNFNYQLTPSIILEIVKWRKETGRDCKIIFTAHDYQLVCPNHISVKIKSQLAVKRKRGDFVGSFATYGYQKDPSNHTKLIIDELAAENVQSIFRWKISGMSNQGIADRLNAGKVPSPAARKLQSGAKLSLHFRKSDEPPWSAKAVDRILHNEVYIGKLVQGKTRRLDYRSKKKMNVPMRDWVIVDNTHGAIIPAEQFELVQRILETETRRPNDAETVALFAGFLYCGDCGSRLVRRSASYKGKRYIYYQCSGSKQNKGSCTIHNLRDENLYNIVRNALQMQIQIVMEEAEFVESIRQAQQEPYRVRRIERQIRQLTAEKAHTQGIKEKLYGDYAEEILTREDFLNYNELYSKRIEEYDRKITELEAERQNLQTAPNTYPFLDVYRKYRKLEEITRPMVVELIEKIEVYEGNRVEITFQFQDEIADLLEELHQKQMGQHEVSA